MTKNCVFPFTYKNVTFSWCTKFDTSNEKAWCAIYPTKPGGIVALYTAEHWDDCEERCQNSCYNGEGCADGYYCHYDSHCQLKLCGNSPDDCGPGRMCMAQMWCDNLHGFERCPRECGMKLAYS